MRLWISTHGVSRGFDDFQQLKGVHIHVYTDHVVSEEEWDKDEEVVGY